jgi:hypothetical protein
VVDRLDLIQTDMKLSARHGDYCYWNCFVDNEEVFRVIDWEFVHVSDWVIIDYLSNLLVLWIDLKRKGILTGSIQSLFSPNNSEEQILSQSLMDFVRYYKFSLPEVRLYLVYVFINIYMRRVRPVSSNYWLPYVGDMITILN